MREAFLGLCIAVLLALAATGCAHGTDGLRQGCATADVTLEGGYSVTGALIRADLPATRAQGDTAKLQRHEAAFGAALGYLDAARASKDAICKTADAIDAGAKGDVPALVAKLVEVGLEIEKVIADLKGALK